MHPDIRPSLRQAFFAALLVHCAPATPPSPHEAELDHEQTAAEAAGAETQRQWQAPVSGPDVAHVRILGLNDFHGQIMGGAQYGKTFRDAQNVAHPVGGIGALTAWLKDAQAAAPGGADSVLITLAGDFVGASVPQSGLLRDEPAVLWFNQLANAYCVQNSLDAQNAPSCNLVATVGNHEFDEGKEELFRKILGGDADGQGPFAPYAGARYPYVVSNVVDAVNGELLFPPYVIRKVDGEQVGFIGAVTRHTADVVAPAGVAGLSFLDEATEINRYVPELQALGVHSIVVLIHEGGAQGYDPTTLLATAPLAGPIIDIVSKLDADIDVVLSGHSHAFTNALLPNAGGAPTLVTQAFSYSTAFAVIDLEIDRATHEVSKKSGRIQVAFADSGPGLAPDPSAQALVDAAVAATDGKISEAVGNSSVPLIAPRNGGDNAAGESNIGDLISDAYRAESGADIAIMNPGGIRADLPAGPLTWGQLYAVTPFANDLVNETLSGQDLWSALAEQWSGNNTGTQIKMLQLSGMSYAYHCGPSCTVDWVKDAKGQPIANDASQKYKVSMAAFLAGGGDNFPALAGSDKQVVMLDLDALVDYVKKQGNVGGPTDTRISRGPDGP